MEKKDLLANYAASKQNMCITNDTISDRLFQEYGVNRGLRDVNGKGVLTGLTRISKIVSFKDENGKQVPCDGELWYRGYNVKTLIKSIGPNEFGFEKAAYLLLFGELPDQAQLDEFCEVLGNSRTLPTNFTRDVIMKALRLMPDAEMELPYNGAKEMILVDNVDDRQFLCELVESMWEELPMKKSKKKKGI